MGTRSRLHREFSWVLDNKLAGMPRPGSDGDLEGDLSYLHSQGIGLLVSLTETVPDPEALARYQLNTLHLPVEDFHPPSLDQLSLFVSRVDDEMAQGRRIGVHCAAGKGRTGTFLAAYFVSLGRSPSEAIQEVRRLRPGSVETEEQESIITEFANLPRAHD